MVRAKAPLTASESSLRAALTELQDGDLERARVELERAATDLDAAGDDLHRPWGVLGQFVPVVAQHQRAVVELTDGAEATVAGVLRLLDLIDAGTIGLDDGRIDPARIAELRGPIDEVVTATGGLVDSFTADGVGWLVSPVAERLQRLADDVVPATRHARQARKVSPSATVCSASTVPPLLRRLPHPGRSPTARRLPGQLRNGRRRRRDAERRARRRTSTTCSRRRSTRRPGCSTDRPHTSPATASSAPATAPNRPASTGGNG